jgi:hypothetical protein
MEATYELAALSLAARRQFSPLAFRTHVRTTSCLPGGTAEASVCRIASKELHLKALLPLKALDTHRTAMYTTSTRRDE